MPHSFARAATPWIGLLLLSALALYSSRSAAQAYFDGAISTDYDIGYVTDDGYEDVSTWISIDAIHNDTPGPMSSPPLAVVVRLSQSEHPADAGYDVAWWPLGRLAPGESLVDLHTEIWSDDIPAGEYYVHTLLVEDTGWNDIIDAHTESWTRIWRGGIELRGELYVDRSYPYELYFEVPGISNNLLYDSSDRLELRFYATTAPGPAADGYTLCSFSLDGLWAGDSYSRSSYRCDINAPLYDDERVHVEIRERGAPAGDTLSEKDWGYSEPDAYLYAGSLSPMAMMVLLSLMGLRRRRIR